MSDSDFLVDDSDAWEAFPHHRLWFNKLWLSEQLGYACGPAGVAPKVDGQYIVRPIYNLSGMGVGAFKAFIRGGDTRVVPPGSFWCEWFTGPHVSVSYEWKDGCWVACRSWRGHVIKDDLSKFLAWKKCDVFPALPSFFDALADVGLINVEFIDGHPIEVHLRESPDPLDCWKIVPVWADNASKLLSGGFGGRFVPSFDDADGFLANPRLGFFVFGEDDE